MSLTVITGPMFAGKTTTLISMLNNAYSSSTSQNSPFSSSSQRISGLKVLLINAEIDTRPSRNTIKPFDYKQRRSSSLAKEDISGFDVIGIDEAQFFDDLSTVIDWVKEGKIVYVAGLSHDSKQNIFGRIVNIMPYCSQFIRLNALCSRCMNEGKKRGGKGLLTVKINESETLIQIGSENLYETLCLSHFSER